MDGPKAVRPFYSTVEKVLPVVVGLNERLEPMITRTLISVLLLL